MPRTRKAPSVIAEAIALTFQGDFGYVWSTGGNRMVVGWVSLGVPCLKNSRTGGFPQ